MTRNIVIAVIFLLLLLAGGMYILNRPQANAEINSYAECVAAGYPIAESDPPQCRTPDGRTFTGFMQTMTPTLLPETPTVVMSPDDDQSEANIIVNSPKRNQVVGTSFKITGTARVFENALNYRVKSQNGKTLHEGNLMALSPEIGQYGPFEVEITDTKLSGKGTVEVFSYSAKDGSEINTVVVPVVFTR